MSERNTRVMMKHSKLKLFIFLSLLMITAVAAYLLFLSSKNHYKNYEITASSEIKLRYNLKIRNTDKNNEASIILDIAKVPNIPPFQRSKLISVSRKSSRIYYDKNKNIIFEYALKIPAMSEETLTFDYFLNNADVIFKIKPELAAKDSFKEFTLYEPYIESTNERIIEKAKIVNNEEDNSYYQSLNNYDYITAKYDFDITLKPKSALEALDGKVLQCQDSAFLYTALCRALGIPCRIFGGIYYWDEKSKDYTETHAWCETYLGKHNGWIPVDPTQGRFDEFTRYSNFAQNTMKHIYLWKDRYSPFSLYFKGKASGSKIISTLSFEIEKIDASKKEIKKRYMKIKPPREKDFWAGSYNMNNGFYFLENEDYAAAFKFFKNLTDKNPDDLSANLFFILSADCSGNIKSLIAEYFSKINRREDSKDVFLLGTALIYDNKYTISEKYLKKALKSGVDVAYVYASLGQLYEKTEQKNKALLFYKKSLDLNPENLFARISLFRMFFDLHDWDSIIYYAEKDENYYKNSAFFPLLAGCAYLNKKDFNKSVSYLKKACKTAPLLGSPRILLGLAYKELKNYKAAKREIDMGIKLKKGVGDPEFFKNISSKL